MARMQSKVSKRTLFILFTLAALILLLCPEKLTGKLQFAFARLFHWPLRVSRALFLSAQIQQHSYEGIDKREYDQLVNHLERLEELLKQEHEKVERLANYRDRLPLAGAGLPFAGITASSINSSNGKLIINRGFDDGLKKGQFVLADNSIIGIISQVSAQNAQVMLTSDPAFKTPVIISDLNVKKFMVGIGNNLSSIELLETKHNIEIGDFVFVQLPGLDGPVVIGKIKHFHRDSQKPLLWDVTVEPACSIKGLQYVNIIIQNPER